MEDFECIFEDFLIHKKELIFFPMNDSKGMTPQSGSHWYACFFFFTTLSFSSIFIFYHFFFRSLLVFDRNAKGYFRHFDSARSGSGNMTNVNRLVNKLFPLLKTKNNEFHVVQEKTPQQKNGFDCGPYVCRIAELLSQEETLHEGVDFEPLMPKLRSVLYNDILNRNSK
jgi:Ulp1 family protease